MEKVAIVGCGLRMLAFTSALSQTYCATHTVVALLDIDPGKMAGFARASGLLQAGQYTDFDRLCEECRPDLLIIGTVDAFHAEYVVRALDRKIAVICEKPLCINRQQCRDILAAQERNPEVFAVTSHNSRYRPVARTLKKLLQTGVVGRILSLEYRETLDQIHGKSYFRRWNSRRKYSNGLELHKSSHHFDKMNYLLDSHAVEVTASGALLAYGAQAAHRFSGINCHTCVHRSECPDVGEYNKDLFDSTIYTPDLCIWSPEIDIEDTFAASIRFANGVFASYSLCAYASYEGEVIHLQGENGRIEARQLNYKSSAEDVHNMKAVPEESIRIYRFGSPTPEEIPIEHEAGSHGGADKLLFSELFASPPSPALPTLQDGIYAVLTGAAVVESIQQRKQIQVGL
ncbi:MAG: Gfo/Idh/MocA family oxidoreductase [Lentisphaeria bacterium]